MRHDLVLLSIASFPLLGVCGCAVASGEVAGGDPLFDAAAPAPSDAGAGIDGPSTWTALYADYFGPTGVANCASLGSCHSGALGTGYLTSGFSYPLPPDKDGCWQGMTTGICNPMPATGCPIVVGGGDPTATTLYKYLRKTAGCGTVACNMPLNGKTFSTPGYIFTPGDMARIAQWIKDGALNN